MIAPLLSFERPEYAVFWASNMGYRAELRGDDVLVTRTCEGMSGYTAYLWIVRSEIDGRYRPINPNWQYKREA